MSVQVSVRLPDELVAQVDSLVSAGAARSRAEVVESALERELRRRLYERDAAIYAEHGEDPEIEDFLTWSRTRGYPSADEQ
ncbi:MAG: ribbon-helix-helix domain-containing protein [Dermatophilus congolensis]|nr:ribbon-helix-helix domain-containing protein [Dermatophilus congolensis]